MEGVTSLVAQRLGLQAPSKGGTDSNPTQGTKVSEAMQHSWKKRKNVKRREKGRKEEERKEKRKKVGGCEQAKESILPSHFPATFSDLTALSA